MSSELPSPHWRSHRLQGYDYTQAGAYFITICAHERAMLFGQIVAEAMQLNALGEVVAEEWIKSATIRQEIELDSWIVMPNHLHGILVIKDSGQSAALDHPTPKQPAQRPQRKPHSVGAFIAGFKSAVT